MRNAPASGGNAFIPEEPRGKGPVADDPSSQTKHKAGLPAFQVLSCLPGKSQWLAGKRTFLLVYGGGTAPALHGIPY
jgi:hypothetical protein